MGADDAELVFVMHRRCSHIPLISKQPGHRFVYRVVHSLGFASAFIDH